MVIMWSSYNYCIYLCIFKTILNKFPINTFLQKFVINRLLIYHLTRALLVSYKCFYICFIAYVS
jgi:hypothetical protein